ncbi:MAG: hypothetical protein IAX21_07380 [Candidatus Bathyarchaeota archaeon]|nr:MAG: hypothetical protein IAX21_07380 [Candidatus Bathyarchaeota archaeon]
MIQNQEIIQKKPLRLGHGPVLQLREQDKIELKKAAFSAKLQSFYSNDYYKWQNLLNKLVQDPRTPELDLIAGKQLLEEIKTFVVATN